MSSLPFIKAELAAALARGVRQFVVLGSRPQLLEAFAGSPDQSFQVFTVDEEQPPVLLEGFVPAPVAREPLGTGLETSGFDKESGSLFLWFGDAGYRTVDAVIAGLSLIASLPKGSGVVFDYAEERTSLRAAAHTALDALASRLCTAGGVRYLIQPQAVAAMLCTLGFRQIVDFAQSVNGRHLVSAIV